MAEIKKILYIEDEVDIQTIAKIALEDICAFANNGEGTLYFGLTDEGNVVGQTVSDATLKKVVTTILLIFDLLFNAFSGKTI